MKKCNILFLITIVTIGVAFNSCVSKKPVSSVQPTSEKYTSEIDSVSYIIGKANISQLKKNMEIQMESWPIKGNVEAFTAGLLDGIKNVDDTLFLGKNMKDLDEYLGSFFQKLQMMLAEEQFAEGERFLAENIKNIGVKTTESGLQYKVLTEGAGEKPNASDVVKIHYTGKFIDGTVFDSSYDRDEPLELVAGNFVRGFTEGLLLMPVGSKYQLWIPSELAYGAQGNQGIKPNSTLIFEVELLDIVKQ